MCGSRPGGTLAVGGGMMWSALVWLVGCDLGAVGA